MGDVHPVDIGRTLRKRCRQAIVTFLIVTSPCLSWAAAPVVFRDGDFAEGAWSTDAIMLQGSAPVGRAGLSADGGNPGAYWRSEIALRQGEGMRLEHFYQPQTYDPRLSGAIERIDYRIDSAFFSSGTFGQHLLLRQDDMTFYYLLAEVGSDWRTDQIMSLTSVNFFSLQDRTAHPDFSATGKPIQLGFSRQQFISRGAQFTGIHGADNWQVTLHRGERQTLVPAGATWKYSDDGLDLGTPDDGDGWYGSEAFDDSKWKSGPAPFGYGEQTEATVVGFGPDANDKFMTTYLRHEFEVENVEQLQKLTLNLQRDDAAAIYLNGELILLDNLPRTLDYRTPAIKVESDVAEYRYFLHELPTSVLHNGRNTLAVELHQDSGASDDLRFDLELSASIVPEPTMTTAVIGCGVLLAIRHRRRMSDCDA